MSDLYESMRAFIRAEVRAEVTAAKFEIRDMLTRDAPKVIEGPPGKDGRDGVDGKNGLDGKDGTPGIGERGADGINGRDGKDGELGPAGLPSTVPGPKGDTGERGADGIATREELESIAREITADLQVRTFADTYQGVYENGRLYERGLLTTWGGSLWLSEKETKAKPGESPDWKLVVKRGADGKK